MKTILHSTAENCTLTCVPSHIDQHHWEEWLASAVDPSIIALNVRSIHDPGEVDRVLERNSRRRWQHSDDLVPCWEVTGLDPLGWERTLEGVQVKPDEPPLNRDGKAQKYLGATGYDTTPLFLETPIANYWEEVRKDRTYPVILTEGAKKAGAGLSIGHATISIPGVATCRKLGRLHRWLQAFCGLGRTIYLCFDNDIMHKKPVQDALWGLGRLVCAAGSVVKIIMLPPGESKGMDDYISRCGEEGFLKRIDEAVTLEEWRKGLEQQWNRDDTGGDSRRRPASRKEQYMNIVQEQWGHRLRFNEMTLNIELDGKSLDMDTLDFHLLEEFGMDIGIDAACRMVARLAKQNSYSPVREYLESVAAQYPDVNPDILSDIATRYFGTDELLHNVFMRNTLIGAVNRVFNPGCQLDTVCVLQGRQGIQKSKFWATLAGNADWFDDTLATSGNDRDERIKLRRFWILELAEIESVFKKKEIASLRGFITTKHDNLRLPYGRKVESFPRTSCFVATVNPDEFLVDPEGHRRYWVIPVGIKRIDLDTLKQERDLLWAAAVHSYRKGERYWLDSEQEQRNEMLNKRYGVDDTWGEAIAIYLEHQRETTIRDILHNCLKIELSQQDKIAQMRVADCLKQMDWVRTTKRVGGKLTKAWLKRDEVTEVVNGVVTTVVTACNLDKTSISEVELLHNHQNNTKLYSTEKNTKTENRNCIDSGGGGNEVTGSINDIQLIALQDFQTVPTTVTALEQTSLTPLTKKQVGTLAEKTPVVVWDGQQWRAGQVDTVMSDRVSGEFTTLLVDADGQYITIEAWDSQESWVWSSEAG